MDNEVAQTDSQRKFERENTEQFEQGTMAAGRPAPEDSRMMVAAVDGKFNDTISNEFNDSGGED